MENDEFYDIDGFETESSMQENNESTDNVASSDDMVDALLKARGINDTSKIKVEDDSGAVEEKSWNDLSDEDKFAILNDQPRRDEEDLDDKEVALINDMRQKNMSPEEYIKYIQLVGIESYMKNALRQATPSYTVDDYTDDLLFVADALTRFENLKEDEVTEMLNNAKANPDVYKKQIESLRKEYKSIEDENRTITAEELRTHMQNEYNRFASSVALLISRMNDFAGYDLNMNANDKQLLYEFVTGFDAAGLNHFAKVLADPEMLVKAAFFALNGEQMIKDITNYFKNEITKVRKYYTDDNKNNRLKGSTVVFANKNKSLRSDDIDF